MVKNKMILEYCIKDWDFVMTKQAIITSKYKNTDLK